MKNSYIILIVILSIAIVLYYFLFKRGLYSSPSKIIGNEHDYDKIMIVAHPDDELIFGGKELVSEPGWKVVSITNGSDCSGNIFRPNSAATRRKEFISCMAKLGCSYEIWDFEDNLFNSNWNEILLTKQLIELLKEKEYKKIVTHNLQGEYGHNQHKKVSRLLWNIRPKNLYMFGYDENKINPYLEKINELLASYSSQKSIIDKYYSYIVHQSLEKIS